MCSEHRRVEVGEQHADGEQPGLSALTSAPRNQAKPTAAIRSPKRLSGRRHQANSPVPMNDQPTKRNVTDSTAVGLSWSEASPSASADRPTTTPSSATSPSARRRPIMGPEQLLHALAGELGLRHEPARARVCTSGPKSEESRLEVRITFGEPS